MEDETNAIPGGPERPCLTGRSRDVNVHGPDYWLPFRTSDGGVLSIDNLRLRVVFTPSTDGKESRFEEMAATLAPGGDVAYKEWTQPLYPGRYRGSFSYGFRAPGDLETDARRTVFILAGRVDGATKVHPLEGVIEFNPNKLAKCPEFWPFLKRLGRYVRSAEVVRYDLAYDVAVPRALVRVRKDRRAYEVITGQSITEYLGQRNANGRLKVYDKAAESRLPGDLTRIELTCAGSWGAEEVAAKMGNAFLFGDADGGDGETKQVVQVLSAVLGFMAVNGGEVESYLSSLDRRTRSKVRDLMAGTQLLPRVEEMAKAVELAIDTWPTVIAQGVPLEWVVRAEP